MADSARSLARDTRLAAASSAHASAFSFGCTSPSSHRLRELEKSYREVLLETTGGSIT
jgi:hypothetical protein